VVESATLAAIEADVLRPSVVERAVQLALDALGADRPDDRGSALRRELTRTEAELGRLAAAVAEGGSLATLVGAMQAREAQGDPYAMRSARSTCSSVAGPLIGRRSKPGSWNIWPTGAGCSTAAWLKRAKSSRRCSRIGWCSPRRRTLPALPAIGWKDGSRWGESSAV
jgi:hypothetical protein